MHMEIISRIATTAGLRAVFGPDEHTHTHGRFPVLGAVEECCVYIAAAIPD